MCTREIAAEGRRLPTHFCILRIKCLFFAVFAVHCRGLCEYTKVVKPSSGQPLIYCWALSLVALTTECGAEASGSRIIRNNFLIFEILVKSRQIYSRLNIAFAFHVDFFQFLPILVSGGFEFGPLAGWIIGVRSKSRAIH